MDFVNQIVIHKVWGECTIVKQEDDILFIIYSEEEKRFKYPDSFADFLRFKDEQLQINAWRDLQKKETARQQAAAKQDTVFVSPQTYIPSTRKAKPIIEKSNIIFKCNFCDGQANKKHLGYMGACSDQMIHYNIHVAQHSWCSDPDCACARYLNGEITGTQLDDLCRDGGFVCYESQMLKDWTAYAGFVLNGEKKAEPKKLRNVQLGSLAALTTREPGMQECDRFIFAVFLVDELDEGTHGNEGYVKSNSKYRIELAPDEAHKIKFWNYHANGNSAELPRWGQGLHRYATDMEAAQILRDIVAVKQIPNERKFAEEFLAHFCKTKGIRLEDIPSPNGALKR